VIAKSLLQEFGADDVRVFFSYARKDQQLRKEVERSLGALDWDVAVRTWYDGEIPAGADWAADIDRNLAAADIVLLFVTQGFVESAYIRDNELPLALARHDRGEARVVPVILEDTRPPWRELELARLQVLPRNGVAVSAWDDRRRALEEVAQGLIDLIVGEGMLPLSRVRWELHLDGELEQFAADDQRELIATLRELSADRALRLVGRASGSILLTLESTGDAYAKIAAEFEAGRLAELVRRKVLRLLQLFGAGVHASSGTAGPDAARPEHPPDPERMVLPTRSYVPVLLKGMWIDPDEPAKNFSWTVDSGSRNLEGVALERETNKLTDFFLTSLAVPDADMFVNLAPDENARLLPEVLTGTASGTCLLEFDYRLKCLSASLLHPDLDSGRDYWREVRRRCAAEGLGADAPLSSFQRVWIVPSKAGIFEGTKAAMEHILSGKGFDDMPKEDDGTMTAFIYESRLEALTREHGGASQSAGGTDRVSAICDEVFREIVLPIVEREVNEGEGFAEIRQFYNALVLATWFKTKFKDHPKAARFIDSGNPRQLRPQLIDTKDLQTGETRLPAQAVVPAAAGDSAATDNAAGAPDEERFRLAIEKREAGEVAASIALLGEVVAAREGSLGREHHATLVALSQLGRSHLAAGDPQRARELHEEVLETRRRQLGDAHEFTCNSMEILAATLLACGEDVRARRLQADAAEQRVRASPSYRAPENREYFERYLDVFRNGVVYVERDEYDAARRKKVRRAYFTGALDFRGVGALLAASGLAGRRSG
jgi:hypothetical protein